MSIGKRRRLLLAVNATLLGALLLVAAPQPALAADLEDDDFVVGVRRPDPLHPLEEWRRGGRILHVRGGVSTTFCDSTPARLLPDAP